MKKIFISAFAGLLCMCTACNTPATTTADNDNKAQEEKNLAASNVVGKAFETGDVTGVDSVVADDFIDHTDRGDVKGKDSLKAMATMIHTNFKDMKMEKVNDAANGDYVYTWMNYSGTSDGTMGLPKGPFNMNGIELTKFKDGKAVEHWNFMDSRDVAKMMPQPAMSNMDTTKMKKK